MVPVRAKGKSDKNLFIASGAQTPIKIIVQTTMKRNPG
jgi:hypothetical protein